ncbi:hypothetical protein EBU71_03970 [bacterium]|nr:hypothetical protein [Candidatus Elulimicrobium humile]
MKILFVSKFLFPDYQSDMIYHGLIDSGIEVYETSFPSYMLNTYKEVDSLYGRGFSIFAKLKHTSKVDTQEEIKYKISNKFYDIIIFGSVQRDLSYLEYVKSVYSKEQIHLVDGEDSTTCLNELIQIGTYWKRECIYDELNPINFAIPESQFVSNTQPKTDLFAPIIPGDPSTYIYTTEREYYSDYQRSYYGKTWKKGGWDCMRHYEILANKCVPYFPGLEDCPKQTLVNFPKKLILESNLSANKGEVIPSYEDFVEELFEYTKQNLTTKKLVEIFF